MRFPLIPLLKKFSRNVRVVSKQTHGQTHGQTNGRTDRQLNKKLLRKNYFFHIFVSSPWICFQMVLKPFSLHEVSIDTTAEEICQEM